MKSTSIVETYISTQDTAGELGYSVQHTRLLVRQGKLKAVKFGRDWMVLRESVAEYQTQLNFATAEESEPPKLRGVVNVASVPMRSPFRYPGGKTWLVPHIRQWLQSRPAPFTELVEPFAGGAIVSLTAVFEDLVKRVTLAEIDQDVAAVWRTILNGRAQWLADKISSFDLSRENIQRELKEARDTIEQRAFATILRNRINRGGILAPGAGVVKNGENGKGLASRWYPATLRKRILDIAAMKPRIRFLSQDGIEVLRRRSERMNTAFFIDPPYTVAGRRLYTHSEIDHEELFKVARALAGDFLMTYDDSNEIRFLAVKYGFATKRVPMKNTHHEVKMELLIGRRLEWLLD